MLGKRQLGFLFKYLRYFSIYTTQIYDATIDVKGDWTLRKFDAAVTFEMHKCFREISHSGFNDKTRQNYTVL